MTFRFPSLTTTNFCKEVEQHNRCFKIHELNIRKGCRTNVRVEAGRITKIAMERVFIINNNISLYPRIFS